MSAMADLLLAAKKRLQSLGYEPQEGDKPLLTFALQKVESTIKNDCNVAEIPEGLRRIAVDMAVGEFLQAKKAFAPESLAGLDLEAAVKEIRAGDTTVSFATGEGSSTPEQRLNALISWLLTYGRSQLSCYRRIRW